MWSLFNKRFVRTNKLWKELMSWRQFSNGNSKEETRKRAQSTMNYVIAGGVTTLAMSYAAVPLYRIFCQVLTINQYNLN